MKDSEVSILEAKTKALSKIKDINPVFDVLKKVIADICKEHNVSIDDLWPWTLEQIFESAEKPKAHVPQKLVKTANIPKKISNVTDNQEHQKPAAQKPQTVLRKDHSPLESTTNAEFTRFQSGSLMERKIVIRQTKNISLLSKAIADTNGLVRLEAVSNKNITEDLLQKVVQQDANLKVKRAAIDRISDQGFLQNTAALKDGDLKVRQKSIRKIRNPDFLKSLLDNNPPQTITKHVISALDNIKKAN